MIEPFPYQAEAIDRVKAEFARGVKSTLVVHPTGLGKSILAGLLARWVVDDLGGRVLFMAHRDPLIQQAHDRITACGVDVAIEKGDQDAWQQIDEARLDLWKPRDIRCVVASVQTLHEKRLFRRPRDYFKLIVTDEAHHACSRSYARIYRHFAGAWHLGLTATPDRMDGDRLPYETLAHELPLDWAIREGWLARLFVEKCSQKIDLRGLKTTGKDYNLGDLEDRISAQIEPLVNGAREKLSDRPAIVFTPDVRSARAFADGLNQVGIAARAIWGDCPDGSFVLRSFAAGDFQCLCNCAKLTEGYDAPWARAIVLARPTKSRGLMLQMLGRGTRRHDGKSDCMAVDYGWLLDDHKPVSPVSPVEVLGGRAVNIDARTPDPVTELAKELVASGYQPDLLSALEEAREHIRQRAQARARENEEARQRAAAERAERERLRVHVSLRDSRLSWRRYDPIGVPISAIVGRPPLAEIAPGAPVLASQVNVLGRYGVPEDEARRLTAAEASEYVRLLDRRDRESMATVKQVRVLLDNGYTRDEAWGMSRSEASFEIDRVLASRKKSAG